MPRGGSHLPDGWSPFKAPDGRELRILKSTGSSNGYYRVVEQHPGKFYPKMTITKVNGEKQKGQKVFGKGKATAREAGIVLALFEDKPYELPEAPPRKRAPLSPTRAKWNRYHELLEEALVLEENLNPAATRPTRAEIKEVEPGVWMVCAEATPFGTPTKAPSVAFSAL